LKGCFQIYLMGKYSKELPELLNNQITMTHIGLYFF